MWVWVAQAPAEQTRTAQDRGVGFTERAPPAQRHPDLRQLHPAGMCTRPASSPCLHAWCRHLWDCASACMQQRGGGAAFCTGRTQSRQGDHTSTSACAAQAPRTAHICTSHAPISHHLSRPASAPPRPLWSDPWGQHWRAGQLFRHSGGGVRGCVLWLQGSQMATRTAATPHHGLIGAQTEADSDSEVSERLQQAADILQPLLPRTR